MTARPYRYDACPLCGEPKMKKSRQCGACRHRIALEKGRQEAGTGEHDWVKLERTRRERESLRYVRPERQRTKYPTATSDHACYQHTDEQREWLVAVDRLARRLHRRPTYPEVLAEAKAQGYRKTEAT